MSTVLIWLLIATSDGSSYNKGTVTVIEKFADATQCEHVRQHIPNKAHVESVCVQARVIDQRGSK